MRRDRHSDRRLVRKYVSAILSLALEADSWESWDGDLETLSMVVRDGPSRRLLFRPRASVEQRIGYLRSVCAGIVGDQGIALAALLLDDASLDLLPSVWIHYRNRSEHEGPVNRVLVTSAVPLSDRQREELDAKLQRPGRRTLLQHRVDADLLGGLVIREGDWRRDFSVRARLTALRDALSLRWAQ